MGISQKSELELLLDEMDGKENSAAADSFYRINLSDREKRMVLLENKTVRKGSANAAGFVYFDGSFFSFPGTHADCSWHIDVACGEEAMVGVSV